MKRSLKNILTIVMSMTIFSCWNVQLSASFIKSYINSWKKVATSQIEPAADAKKSTLLKEKIKEQIAKKETSLRKADKIMNQYTVKPTSKTGLYIKKQVHKKILEAIVPSTTLGRVKLIQLLDAPAIAQDHEVFGSRQKFIQNLVQQPELNTKLINQLKRIEEQLKIIFEHNIEDFNINVEEHTIECSERPAKPFQSCNIDRLKKSLGLLAILYVGWTSYSTLASQIHTTETSNADIFGTFLGSLTSGLLTLKFPSAGSLASGLLGFFSDTFRSSFTSWVINPVQYLSGITINFDLLIPTFRMASLWNSFTLYLSRQDSSQKKAAKQIAQAFSLLHTEIDALKALLATAKDAMLQSLGYNMTHRPGSSTASIAHVFNAIGHLDACSAIAASVTNKKALPVKLITIDHRKFSDTIKLLSVFGNHPAPEDVGVLDEKSATFLISPKTDISEAVILDITANIVLAHTLGIIIPKIAITKTVPVPIPWINISAIKCAHFTEAEGGKKAIKQLGYVTFPLA